MKKENYTTKNGKQSERYVLAELSGDAVELLRGGKYLAWVDRKAGKVYATEMKGPNKLPPEEVERRAKEKAKTHAAYIKRINASAQKKIADLEAKIAKRS